MSHRGGTARLFLAASAAAIAAGAQASETTSYQYDALGRLVGVTSSGTVNNGVATSIGYDPAGNRASYSVGGAGGSAPPPPPPGPVPPPPPPGNGAPVTVADTLQMPRCTIQSKNVLSNDTDPEGHYPLALVGVSGGGTRGAATIVSATTIEYESYGTAGTDVITYVVADSLGATSTGTLTVSIQNAACQ